MNELRWIECDGVRIMTTELRFINRDGKKILQYSREEHDWRDVELVNEQPKKVEVTREMLADAWNKVLWTSGISNYASKLEDLNESNRFNELCKELGL